MSSEWKTVPFGDLYAIPSRNGLTKPKRVRGDGYKFINMGEIFAYSRMLNIDCDRAPATEKELETSTLEAGDLLFARQSLVLSGAGKCSIFLGDDETTIFESHLIRVRPDSNQVLPEYLYYYFNSPIGRSEIWRITEQGAGQAGIRGSDLETVRIKLPSLDEQSNIVAVLTAIDDKIELNRQINTTLESMAHALFKSWFVDFDPVIDNVVAAGNPIPDELSARAERRKNLSEKSDNPHPPLPADIQQLFPSSFVFTEEMGWVPEGWKPEKLASEIDVLNGFAFKSVDYEEKGIFLLRTKNFNSSSMVDLLPEDVHLPSEFLQSHEKYLCESYDYHLIMVGASVGNRGMILPHQLPALRNQNMWCFRPIKRSRVSKVFTKHLLDSIIGEKMGLASGSAREFFRKGDFQNHLVVFGTDKVQEAFVSIAHPYLSRQSVSLAQAGALEEIRDSLLPKLLSGQLQIPEAEQQLAKVI